MKKTKLIENIKEIPNKFINMVEIQKKEKEKQKKYGTLVKDHEKIEK